MIDRARLEVAVYGLINAGKSSLINALAGSTERPTGPIGGTTREVAEVGWREVDAEVGGFEVRLLDTPGLEEVGDEARSGLAVEAASRADLVAFVVAEDLTATARKALIQLREIGKPIVVALNKVDLLSPEEEASILAAIRDRLDGIVPPEDVIAIAAAPIVREKVREGDLTRVEARRGGPKIELLVGRLLVAIAESGADLKDLNEVRDQVEAHARTRDMTKAERRGRAERVADETSAGLALALAVNPIPLLDFLTGPAGLAVLVTRVSAVYGESPSADAARSLAGDLIKGGRARLWGSMAAVVAGGAMKVLPGVGHLAGAAHAEGRRPAIWRTSSVAPWSITSRITTTGATAASPPRSTASPPGPIEKLSPADSPRGSRTDCGRRRGRGEPAVAGGPLPGAEAEARMFGAMSARFREGTLMRMRLLSPFRCHLNIETSKVLSNEEDYGSNWALIRRAVQPDLDAIAPGTRVEYLHEGLAPMAMRFQNLGVDGSFFPPELLRVRPPADSSFVADAAAEAEPQLADAGLAGMAAPEPESLLFRVYDNTIAICELTLVLADEPFFDRPEASIEALQGYTNRLMESIVRRYYAAVLLPLVVAIWRRDFRRKFIERPGSYTGFPDLTIREERLRRQSGEMPTRDEGVGGQILWVNRSLYTSGLDDSRREALLDRWLSLATSEGALREQARARGAVFLGWGHNAFDQPPDSRASDDGWYALLLGQFFYTVLDCTSVGLSHFIGISLRGLPMKETQGLNAKLQDVVSQVQLVTTQFHDTQQNLQGTRRAYFNDLAARWRMDVLTENVEKKIRIVTGLIERLFQRSTRLNQTLVEVMLFAIGGISLVSFGLSLSQFALSVTPSPANDRVPGLLDAGAGLPPDLMIWGCILLLVLWLVVFLGIDRRSRQ